MVGAGDGLSSERSYTTRALPFGVIRGVVDVFWRRDLTGREDARRDLVQQRLEQVVVAAVDECDVDGQVAEEPARG